MRHRVREVEEKRPATIALDESQRPLGVTLRQGRLDDRVFDLGVAVEQAHRPHIVATRDAEVLIKAAMDRQILW